MDQSSNVVKARRCWTTRLRISRSGKYRRWATSSPFLPRAQGRLRASFVRRTGLGPFAAHDGLLVVNRGCELHVDVAGYAGRTMTTRSVAVRPRTLRGEVKRWGLRASIAPLAGEWHQSLERARPAPQACEAVPQHATCQKIPKLLLHEHLQACARKRLAHATRRRHPSWRISRAMTMRWISEVPSPISVSLASRKIRSTGNSVM